MVQAKTKTTSKTTSTPPVGVSGTQLVMRMAEEQQLDPHAFVSTVKASCFQENVTSEQFMAFLMVAREHKLNPITREIYGFAKGGKVVPIVSIDGWLKIINAHPQFDGMQFRDNVDDDGGLISITCQIHRKDRKMPTEVTEYLDECSMPTEPWKKWPARMLRHKAAIQGARYAFGFSGIVDPDEAERIRNVGTLEGSATVVEEFPQSAARRITNKIKDRAEVEVLMPETENPEPVKISKADIGAPLESEFFPEEGDAIRVEDIPGLKKGSELTDEQKSFVKDMDKPE